mgnify:FL=1
MKNNRFIAFISAVFLLALISCNQVKTDLTQAPFIPKPVSVTATGQAFKLENATVIYVQESLEQTGNYLAQSLGKITGATFEVKTSAEVPEDGIYLSLSAGKPELGDEGYELVIGKKLIEIKANQPAGCFNGIQTLLQTLPVKAADEKVPVIATGTVSDYPEFGFRGVMLDVARHFFSVDEVKQLID